MKAHDSCYSLCEDKIDGAGVVNLTSGSLQCKSELVNTNIANSGMSRNSQCESDRVNYAY